MTLRRSSEESSGPVLSLPLRCSQHSSAITTAARSADPRSSNSPPSLSLIHISEPTRPRLI
eukprot:2764753-Rhodomonas_salina.1